MFFAVMKPSVIAAAAASLACASAHAENSNVTLYGLLSTGVAYTNNQGGNSSVKAVNGPMQTPRWGLRGVEDLGDGLSTVFVMESGFSMTNGTASQNGRMFGRQVYVGLQSNDYGTITLGRQYDLANAVLWPYESATQFAAYGTHIGDSDNVFNTFRVNNTVIYKSPVYDGLQVSGMYSLGGQTQSQSNNAYALGLNYQRGGLSLGTMYEVVNTPNSPTNQDGAVVADYGFSSPFVKSPGGAGVDRQRIFGAGGAYKFGALGVSLLYTHVRFDYLDQTRLGLNNAEVSTTYNLSPRLLLGLAYIYTWGAYTPSDTRPKWHQINIGADYFLSKRTDLYVTGIYQRAAGDAQFAQIYTLLPSSGRSQVSTVVGMRHRF